MQQFPCHSRRDRGSGLCRAESALESRRPGRSAEMSRRNELRSGGTCKSPSPRKVPLSEGACAGLRRNSPILASPLRLPRHRPCGAEHRTQAAAAVWCNAGQTCTSNAQSESVLCTTAARPFPLISLTLALKGLLSALLRHSPFPDCIQSVLDCQQLSIPRTRATEIMRAADE